MPPLAMKSPAASHTVDSHQACQTPKLGSPTIRAATPSASAPARRPGVSGAPILDDALAYFDCELTGSINAGDHEVVVGRVIDGRILDSQAAPMSYAETGDMDGSSALYPARF